jgi:hypothetical protein
LEEKRAPGTLFFHQEKSFHDHGLRWVPGRDPGVTSACWRTTSTPGPGGTGGRPGLQGYSGRKEAASRILGPSIDPATRPVATETPNGSNK